MLAQTQDVSVRFGSFTAVNAVNLEVGPGEVVGLLGANGAGKTTLIRLILGLLRPSSGRGGLFGAAPPLGARGGGGVRLVGAAPWLETRRSVGYVPQTLGLYSDLTVLQNWRFVASAFGRSATRPPEEIRRWENYLVGRLPRGVAGRVAFVVPLAREPRLLVLDEPTSGVGPLGAAR